MRNVTENIINKPRGMMGGGNDESTLSVLYY